MIADAIVLFALWVIYGLLKDFFPARRPLLTVFGIIVTVVAIMTIVDAIFR